MPITDLLTTDTFHTWFNKTNEMITRLNTGVISDGGTVYGVFTVAQAANTSLSVSNNFIVNSSAVIIKTATFTIGSNTTVNSSANVVNLSPVNLLIQPSSGTLINSALSVNATTSFLGQITANANVTITNGMTAVSGNITITGTTTANGSLVTRQITFSAANAVAAPSALNNPQYDDYNPTGFAECQILNLTPNIDTVITGLVAPSISSGGRMVFIQNMSASKKITLASANTSSSASNRFGTPSNVNVDILPGATITVIWNYDTSRWRVASPLTTSFSSLAVTGNGSVSGTLTTGTLITTILSVTSGAGVTGNFTVGGYINCIGTLQVTGNTSLTNVAVTSGATFSGNVTSTANASLSNATLVMTASNKTMTFGNTFTANSASQSFVRNLRADTFLVDTTCTVSNVSVTNIFNASTGRMVIPVGTNLWA